MKIVTLFPVPADSFESSTKRKGTFRQYDCHRSGKAALSAIPITRRRRANQLRQRIVVRGYRCGARIGDRTGQDRYRAGASSRAEWEKVRVAAGKTYMHILREAARRQVGTRVAEVTASRRRHFLSLLQHYLTV